MFHTNTYKCKGPLSPLISEEIYMTLEEKIKRINELYHKSKAEGLTEDEKAEQASLRAEYIANVRANLKGNLNTITIQYEDGRQEKLSEKYGDK